MKVKWINKDVYLKPYGFCRFEGIIENSCYFRTPELLFGESFRNINYSTNKGEFFFLLKPEPKVILVKS